MKIKKFFLANRNLGKYVVFKQLLVYYLKGTWVQCAIIPFMW